MRFIVYETRERYTSDNSCWTGKAVLGPDGVVTMTKRFYDALIPEWKDTLKPE